MKDFRKKVISGVVLVTMATYTMPIFAFANEEAIYSKLKDDGEKYKTIISTTIESEDGTENTQIETDKELPVDCKIIYELYYIRKTIKNKGKMEYENAIMKEEPITDANFEKMKMYIHHLLLLQELL